MSPHYPNAASASSSSAAGAGMRGSAAPPGVPSFAPDGDDIWEGGLISYDNYGYDQYGHLSREPVKRSFAERVGGYKEFVRPTIWRAMFTEFWGTMLLVFLLCSVVVGVQWFTASFKDVPFVLVVAIFDVFIVAFLVLATTASSGGHLNMVITFATMLSGLTSVARGLCYMAAQLVGGIAGAAILWGIESQTQVDLYGAGNCHSGTWGPSQMLLAETAFTFAFLFVVFSSSFEPAQRHIYRQSLVPWVIGGAFGLAVFFSGLIGNNAGVWMVPNRCFGAAVVSGDWAHVGIAFAGDGIAAGFIGIYYLIMRHSRPVNHHYYPHRTLFNPMMAQAQMYNPNMQGQQLVGAYEVKPTAVVINKPAPGMMQSGMTQQPPMQMQSGTQMQSGMPLPTASSGVAIHNDVV
jgi:glycerol uptake facilitator-like aquaporin